VHAVWQMHALYDAYSGYPVGYSDSHVLRQVVSPAAHPAAQLPYPVQFASAEQVE
jgi:hypothetical protein